MSGNRRNTGPRAGGAVAPGNNRYVQAKLVLLGDVSVGKSSIAMRFVRGQFSENLETTVGAAFLTQTVQVPGAQSVKFDIWDTAGQERYHSLAPMYYRGAQAAVVVYDINNANTFNRAMTWVRELRTQAAGNVVIVLAGNKADLAAEHRAVSTDEARAYAEENGLIFAEVSAKTGLAITEMFMMIAHKMANKQGGPGTQGQGQGVRLTEDGEEEKKGCKC